MNRAKFTVKTTLLLFVVVVGLGFWTALAGFNKMLARPVCALRVEQVGERDYRVELLGENLDFNLRRGLDAAGPMFAEARQYVAEIEEKVSGCILEMDRSCKKWFEQFRG